MTERVITARNLSVTYSAPRGFSLGKRSRERAGDVEALRGVSFDVSRGEAFGVIGRNGAGKSTLLRVLANTLIPDEGSVEVTGRTSTLLALGVGFNPDLSGHRNIILGSLAAGLSRKEAEDMRPAIVEYAELGNAIHRPLSTYSRGQQSRLAFAIARNLDPEILLIDEVLAVGDESFKQKTLADMRRLLARSGTIVFVSHALGIVREFCDRVLWLDQGETMQIGEPNQVVDAYRMRYVRPEFDLVRDVTGGRDGIAAEIVRRDRRPPATLDIARLRAARSASDPIDYIDLDPLLTAKRAARQGRRILATGWKDTIGGRLLIEAPLNWERHQDRRIDAWEPVGILLAAYLLDGYERMLRPAVDYAVDWIRCHEPDPLGGGVWAPGIVGERACRLAGLAGVASRVTSIPETDVAQLVASSIDHAHILEDPAMFTAIDVAAFSQVAGMFALALNLPEVPDIEKLAPLASERLEQTLRTQFTDDGIHRRHSPLRHATAVKALSAVLGTGLVPPDHAGQTRKRAERALEWFVTPTGHLTGFGDIDPSPISPAWESDLASATRGIKRVWRTSPMRHAASNGRFGSAPTSELQGFHKGGYFVVKTRGERPAHLAMQCGFHNDAGKEADDLSITWHDAGRDLLVDAGRYRGDDETFRRYSMSTRAHNTVEIDGRDHDQRRPKYTSALGAVGTVDGVHYGTAEVQLDTVAARRLLAYDPGSWLLVLDTLRDPSGEAHTYRQWFHAAPEIDVTLTGGTAELGVDGRSVAHAVPLLSAAPLEPSRGVMDHRAQGWHSPGADVVIPNWAFGWHQPSNDHASFAVLFSLEGPIEAIGATYDRGDDTADLAWTAAAGPRRLAIDFGDDVPVVVTR